MYSSSESEDSSFHTYASYADSCDSSDSCRESVRKKDRDLLLQQARLCEKGASRLTNVVASVEASINKLEQVKTWVESRQRQLTGYAQLLSRPGDNVLRNAHVMQPLVNRACRDSDTPTDAALMQLMEHINRLMDKPAKVPLLAKTGPLDTGAHFRPRSATPIAGQLPGGPARGDDGRCSICLGHIRHPKKLSCGDTFCTACIDKAFAAKKRCPKCLFIFSTLTGDQPIDGRMTHTVDNFMVLPGYGPGAIVISYYIPAGIQEACHPKPGQPYSSTARTAYLPNNREGVEVLKMLKKAFAQRLIFTIGESATTGAKGVVTWNDIHHKTSLTGGRMHHGYPDSDYLRRVKEELEADGITSP